MLAQVLDRCSQPSDFLTIALLVALEGLLSADNAMVLAVLVLGLPKAQQQKALRYGIVGAFVFRAVATLAGRLPHPARLGEAGRRRLPAVPRRISTSAQRRTREDAPHAAEGAGRGSACRAFWATVVKVELTDIVFAIDSILVAVAMSPKIWVVLTGGILGIVTMRLVIGRLLALVERYPPLVDGAFVIIAWVGVKLLLEYLHVEGTSHFEIPKWLSLA